MKKIFGLLAIISVFTLNSSFAFAASAGGTLDVPAGSGCGATEDCAAGLVCTAFVCTAGSLGGSTGGGNTAPLASGQLENPIKYDNFADFVTAVLKTAVEILMPFVVLAFIWSGFLFVKAQGNPAELETAKSAIYWSVIGAFILMGAWGFSQIIGTTVTTLTE